MASYLRQRCIRFLSLIWLRHQTHTTCGGTKSNEALLQILVRVGVNKSVTASGIAIIKTCNLLLHLSSVPVKGALFGSVTPKAELEKCVAYSSKEVNRAPSRVRSPPAAEANAIS